MSNEQQPTTLWDNLRKTIRERVCGATRRRIPQSTTESAPCIHIEGIKAHETLRRWGITEEKIGETYQKCALQVAGWFEKPNEAWLVKHVVICESKDTIDTITRYDPELRIIYINAQHIQWGGMQGLERVLRHEITHAEIFQRYNAQQIHRAVQWYEKTPDGLIVQELLPVAAEAISSELEGRNIQPYFIIFDVMTRLDQVKAGQSRSAIYGDSVSYFAKWLVKKYGIKKIILLTQMIGMYINETTQKVLGVSSFKKLVRAYASELIKNTGKELTKNEWRRILWAVKQRKRINKICKELPEDSEIIFNWYDVNDKTPIFQPYPMDGDTTQQFTTPYSLKDIKEDNFEIILNAERRKIIVRRRKKSKKNEQGGEPTKNADRRQIESMNKGDRYVDYEVESVEEIFELTQDCYRID